VVTMFLPASRLAEAVAIQADALMNATVDAGELARVEEVGRVHDHLEPGRAEFIEQPVDARKLSGVRDVFTVERQQILYARQGRRGYVQRVDSCGGWYHRSPDDFVSNRVGVGVHGQRRNTLKHFQSPRRCIGITHACLVDDQLRSDHIV